MEILGRIIWIIVLLLPLGEVIRFEPLSGIAIRPIDAVVSIFAVVAVFVFWKKQLPVKNYPVVQAVLLFTAWCSLSLVYNISHLTLLQFFISLLYLYRWISYALIGVVLLFASQRQKQITILCMHIAGIFLLMIGFMQYVFYPNLRNLYYLGWDDHLYRLFSSFLDPNFAAAFFVLYGLLLAGTSIKLFQHKRTKLGSLLAVVALLDLLAIILTFSRSGLIMLVISSFAFVCLLGKKQWGVGIAIVVLLVIVGLLPFSKTENTNLFRIASSEARLQTAQTALQIIQKNPLMGVGFNAYRYAQIRYGFRSDTTQYVSHADSGTDNSFLFVFATTGVVGLALYLFLQWRIFQFLWYLRAKQKQRIFSIVALSSFLGLCVDSLFNNSLFYVPLMLWVWSSLGTVESP